MLIKLVAQTNKQNNTNMNASEKGEETGRGTNINICSASEIKIIKNRTNDYLFKCTTKFGERHLKYRSTCGEVYGQ